MERILTYAEAIREATEQEMARDDSVIVMGIGADDFKALYGTTRGLPERFGRERVFDTPLSEDGMTGVAIGAALAGLRPIHAHIRMDFLMLAMNQLINIAAKSHYMFGGAVSIPLVVRAIIGRSWGQGAQHSQALHAFFMHTPGLKVVAPSTPYDAKGCMIRAIRDPNPVIFVEHRLMHAQKGHVPAEPYECALDRSRVLATGKDLTLVGISHATVECLRARELLAAEGVEAELIDGLALNPLDAETIEASVRRTGRLLVVDTGWTSCGASAEIVARMAERLGGTVQLRRMGFAPVPCPTTKNLENLFYPTAARIARAAWPLVRPGAAVPAFPEREAPEVVEFKGPF